eukprot:COSAG06_NODE_58387_length_277_cov_0.584270_2_plen_66_part_01
MTAVGLPAAQASALQTTQRGGIANSSGRVGGNVSVNHSKADMEIVLVKTWRMIKKERRKRLQHGAE